MSEEAKPTRTIELSIDISAPAEEVWKALTEAKGLQNWFPQGASVEGTGIGSIVTFSFGPEMSWPTTVSGWEPSRHLQWAHDDMMGPGTRLIVDYYLTTEGGKTRVRLVQSGFGASDAWDDFFDGTEAGWTYFLYNLRLYVERHLGKARRMFMHRFEVTLPRDVAWKKLTSSTGGLVIAAGGALHVGEEVRMKLQEPATVRALIELIIEGHVLAMRIPELDDAVLFIELEVGKEKFGVGAYLSVYDEKKAREAEEPMRRTAERIRAALR
jgi:uncharacterized protein YndB with AHSA1/START domain